MTPETDDPTRLTPSHHWANRLRHHAVAVCGLRPGPLPMAAMLRSGLSIAAGFLLFVAFARLEAAIICAFFTDFLCLADRAEAVATRVKVQVAGGILFVVFGALGIAVAGHLGAIIAVVLALALVAGFVHGTAPGLEALPRFGLCCLVVTAFLPIDKGPSVIAAVIGTIVSVMIVLMDDQIRRGRRRVDVVKVKGAGRPGPRFSLIYGCAAAVGLGVGVLWGGQRPYWVTVTVLLVMQPDRRANTVRVAQRFLGTIAGVVAAFVAVRALPDAVRPTGLLALVMTLPFLWPLGYERNYGLGTAALSAWVLLLIDTALPDADLVTALFRARLSDTAIGCAIALAGSFAFFEAREIAAADG